MAATASSTISGSLALPPDTGQPQCTIPFSVTQNFVGREASVLNLTGSGTKSVDFGTIASPGVKGMLIEVDPDSSGSLAPINVQINGAGAPGSVEIAPGGFWAYANPNPVSGIVSLDIAYTTAACVRIWLLGD